MGVLDDLKAKTTRHRAGMRIAFTAKRKELPDRIPGVDHLPLNAQDVDAHPWVETLIKETPQELLPPHADLLVGMDTVRGQAHGKLSRVPPAKSLALKAAPKSALGTIIELFPELPEVVITIAAQILKGEITSPFVDKEGVLHELPPTIKEREEMIKFFADRIWGRATEHVKIESKQQNPNEIPLESFTTEELIVLSKIEERRLREAAASSEIVDAETVESSPAVDGSPQENR